MILNIWQSHGDKKIKQDKNIRLFVAATALTMYSMSTPMVMWTTTGVTTPKLCVRSGMEDELK